MLNGVILHQSSLLQKLPLYQYTLGEISGSREYENYFLGYDAVDLRECYQHQAEGYSETSVTIYDTTRSHIPELTLFQI
jgi:hypothetical protein